jgi:hypothetical protein
VKHLQDKLENVRSDVGAGSRTDITDASMVDVLKESEEMLSNLYSRVKSQQMEEVSERTSERAGILRPPKSTTKLTHPTRLARSVYFARPSLKMPTISLRLGAGGYPRRPLDQQDFHEWESGEAAQGGDNTRLRVDRVDRGGRR